MSRNMVITLEVVTGDCYAGQGTKEEIMNLSYLTLEVHIPAFFTVEYACTLETWSSMNKKVQPELPEISHSTVKYLGAAQGQCPGITLRGFDPIGIPADTLAAR